MLFQLFQASRMHEVARLF